MAQNGAARLVARCWPQPSCQVMLGAAFDGGTHAVLASDGAVELELSVTNLTNAPISFEYDAPCVGLSLTGLDAYDAWDACLAGACAQPSTRKQVSLAAQARSVLGKVLLRQFPSTCNPKPLLPGTYHPTFTLSGVTGVTTCGPVQTELVVSRDASTL